MADTKMGDFPDKICSDCGVKGCSFIHNGPLVPKGEVATLCPFCWYQRDETYKKGELPKPLGQQPPGIPKEHLGKPLMITTSSGSVYVLGLADSEHEMIVCCERRNIFYVRARVLLLALGQPLWLRIFGKEDLGDWSTSRVIAIQPNMFVKEGVAT